MPLLFVDTGSENSIRKVVGNGKIQEHLSSLGFVPGSSVVVVAKMGENLIVHIKGSRIAISREMAQKIYI